MVEQHADEGESDESELCGISRVGMEGNKMRVGLAMKCSFTNSAGETDPGVKTKTSMIKLQDQSDLDRARHFDSHRP